ncbi:MAG: hypothetical protein ACRC62_13145 [Microcoleus sp.]
MKYWFDTEFIEDGRTIDLISIGIVAEDDREYYAINYDCDFSKASDWVRENVLSKLPAKPSPQIYPTPALYRESPEYIQGWRNKLLLRDEADCSITMLSQLGS